MRTAPLLILALAALACNPAISPADAGIGDGPEQVAQVALVSPAEVSVSIDLSATGTIVGDHRAQVAAGASGRLVSVAVERGQHVRKGDTLAQVDDRLLRASLAEAEATLAQAEANVGTATDEAERTRALYGQDLSSNAALKRAEAAEATAKATVEAARAYVRIARVRVDDARIKAPFDGIIAERKVSPGEFVVDNMPVVDLVGTDGLRVQLTIGERDAARIIEGQAVRIRVAGDTEERTAVIDRISPAFRPGSRDLVIEALIEDSAGLRPGAFATASIATGSRAGLAVPSEAVVTDGAISRIYVQVGDRLEERIVTIGPTVDGRVVVLDGLQSNERVAASVGPTVRDGVRVAG